VSELLVFVFDTENGANDAIPVLQSPQKQQWITLADAATVVRRPDGKAKVLPELSETGAKMLRTNLSAEDEAKLHAAFGAEEESAPPAEPAAAE
jgi:uncharacterized membrane protein